MFIFLSIFATIVASILFCVLIFHINSAFPRKYSLKTITDGDGDVYYMPVKYFIPIFEVGLPYKKSLVQHCPGSFSEISTLFHGGTLRANIQEGAIKYIKEYTKDVANANRLKSKCKYKVSVKEVIAEVTMQDVHS